MSDESGWATGIHTFDSWARAIVADIASTAATRAREKGLKAGDTVDVDLSFQAKIESSGPGEAVHVCCVCKTYSEFAPEGLTICVGRCC
jgi:hypothetical protein